MVLDGSSESEEHPREEVLWSVPAQGSHREGFAEGQGRCSCFEDQELQAEQAREVHSGGSAHQAHEEDPQGHQWFVP